MFYGAGMNKRAGDPSIIVQHVADPEGPAYVTRAFELILRAARQRTDQETRETELSSNRASEGLGHE